jgi:hypothetical protein
MTATAPGAEVQGELDGNARRNDVGRTAYGENDAFQRASFRSARPPPPQTPTRSAFQRGWVGGRSWNPILAPGTS